MMMSTDKPTLRKCANCGTDIVFVETWRHLNGGRYCYSGARPIATNSYLDSPGMRDAHLRSARGD